MRPLRAQPSAIHRIMPTARPIACVRKHAPVIAADVFWSICEIANPIRAVLAGPIVVAALLLMLLSTTASAQSIGTAISYQGTLKFNGAYMNDTVDLRFRLYNSSAFGTAVSSYVDVPNVDVINGLFDVQLDFGASPWTGQARWLEVSVRPWDSVGSYTVLAPRQAITPAPFALYAANAGLWQSTGAAIANSNLGFVGVNRTDAVNSTEYFGIQAPGTGSNFGGMYVRTTSNDGKPYYGYNTNTHTGMTYLNGATGEWRVQLDNADRLTVGATGNVGIGTSTPQSILHVNSNGGEFLLSNVSGSNNVPMLHLRNSTTFADWVFRHEEDKLQIATETTGAEKLTITDQGKIGIGQPAPNAKLHVIATTSETVVHAATTGAGPAGVFNIASPSNLSTALSATTIGGAPAIEGLTSADASQDYISGVGGYTQGNNGIGVFAYTSGQGQGAVGVLGHTDSAGYAGFFEGDVGVAGTLLANDKQFLIDNPANPENEYLSHVCIESDEMKNLYDGVVTLDENGGATVVLPDWFTALNADYRYQLTAIGGAMPNLHIADEMANGRFAIAGGVVGKRVSWQVTGRRIDPSSKLARFQVVRTKPDAERGKYLYPQAYGQPASAGIGRPGNAGMPRAVGGTTFAERKFSPRSEEQLLGR